MGGSVCVEKSMEAFRITTVFSSILGINSDGENLM